MKLFIETKKNEKTGKTFTCLVADLGYTQQVVSFDTNVMILLANLTPQDFYKKTETVGSKIILIDKAEK